MWFATKNSVATHATKDLRLVTTCCIYTKPTLGTHYLFSMITLCHDAAERGDLLALQRARKHGLHWDQRTCAYAARGGHLDILKWARQQDRLDASGLRPPPCPWDEETCAGAAEGGHLHILQWARQQDPPCPWDDATCSRAAKGGHLHILQWARQQDPPCPWGRGTCAYASLKGHLAMLQWARGQDRLDASGLRPPPCPWDDWTCRYAAYGCHLNLLQWVREQDPPCPWDAEKCRSILERKEPKTNFYGSRRWLQRELHVQWKEQILGWMDQIDEILNHLVIPELAMLIKIYI